MNNIRRVVCAANQSQDGFILLGIRHWDKFMHDSLTAAESCAELLCFPNIIHWKQGFVDQHGVFMSREEAWIVANSAGQIVKRVGGDFNKETGIGKLFSENLY